MCNVWVRAGNEQRVAPLYLPLLDDENMVWQEGGTGQKIEKEPSHRRRMENRKSPSPQSPPGAQVTGQIKMKGTYITRYCTYKDTWGVRGFELEERCDTPRCVLLPGLIWSRQQAVGDRLKWHPATSRDTVTRLHIPKQWQPQMTVFIIRSLYFKNKN